MYVCLCNCVTERDVEEAIEEGATTLEEVAYCTRAGTRCGACLPAIAGMLERAEAEPCRHRLRVLTSAA